MAKKRPSIEVTLDEKLAKIKVKMKHAELINARVLQRIIREIQRERRLALKRIIYASKLTDKDYEEKFNTKKKGDTDGGRRRKESPGRKTGETREDDRGVSELAREISGKL